MSNNFKGDVVNLEVVFNSNGTFDMYKADTQVSCMSGEYSVPLKGSLKLKCDELLAKLKDVDANEVKESIEAKMFEIKEALEDLDKEKVLKLAKKKAVEIQDMADELVDFAIEKGTPLLESAAADVRAKAIDVTKEVLEKLENK